MYLGEWEKESRAILKSTKAPVLGLHPHWFLRIDRLEKARQILSKYRHRKLQLLPDTAHLMIAGDDPVAAIREFRGRLAGVHLKDWISQLRPVLPSLRAWLRAARPRHCAAGRSAQGIGTH